MKCLNKTCSREVTSDSNYCFEHKLSPGTITRLLPGNLSLNEISLTLSSIEANQRVELIDLAKQANNNLASFKYVSIAQNLSDLILIEVKTDVDVQSIIAQQTESGKRFLFRSSVVAAGKEIQVVAFR